MLDSVELCRSWESNLIRVRRYNFGDRVWSNTAVVQFAAGSLGGDVLSIKLHKISNLKSRCRFSSFICLFLMPVLRP